MPTIAFDEVRRHNGPKSCWMVIYNEVYDVTKFLDSHPGGASSLLDFAGKDGTLAFESVGHSDDARAMMKKYKIGVLPINQHSSHYKSCMRRKPEPVRSDEYEKAIDTKTIDHRVEFVVYNVDTGRLPRSPKSGYSTPKAASPRIEPRVKTIVVPRERRPRGFPCAASGRARPQPESSNFWIYALLALGTAVIVGIAAKKYLAK